MSAEKTTFAFTNYKLKSNVMKKMLLLSLALLGVVSAFAGTKFADAKIASDKSELNGDRYTQTYIEPCANKGIWKLLGGLKKTTIDGIDRWYITLRITEADFFSIDQGRLLLIKLNDGSIIELKNRLELDKTDNEFYIIHGTTEAVYYLCPEYEITKEQLLKIYQVGAEKLRIELNYGYEEWNAGKRFTTFILDTYKAIDKQCRTKNDMYSNF